MKNEKFIKWVLELATQEYKKRMLNAGLKNKGLSFPDDWDALSEDEKQRRFDEAIEIEEYEKLDGGQEK